MPMIVIVTLALIGGVMIGAVVAGVLFITSGRKDDRKRWWDEL